MMAGERGGIGGVSLVVLATGPGEAAKRSVVTRDQMETLIAGVQFVRTILNDGQGNAWWFRKRLPKRFSAIGVQEWSVAMGELAGRLGSSEDTLNVCENDRVWMAYLSLEGILFCRNMIDELSGFRAVAGKWDVLFVLALALTLRLGPGMGVRGKLGEDAPERLVGMLRSRLKQLEAARGWPGFETAWQEVKNGDAEWAALERGFL